MLTEKDYCDYETCVALRELGYVGSRQECECFGAYFNFGKDIFTDSLDNTEVGTNEYLRVPLYLAQKWLREEKEFYVFVGREWENAYYYWLSKKVEDKTIGITHSFYYSNGEGQFSSYEEALLEGVRKAVKILKEE